jgi:hypothetical protein
MALRFCAGHAEACATVDSAISIWGSAAEKWHSKMSGSKSVRDRPRVPKIRRARSRVRLRLKIVLSCN